MTSPTDRKYTSEHEWVLVGDGGDAAVGITHYAQDQLGDVVFLSLPEVGSRVAQFEKMGEVESVKAVSDLWAPVSGEVIEVNTGLADNPEWLNEDPFGKAWMIRVRLDDPNELENLMSAAEYEQMLQEEQSH